MEQRFGVVLRACAVVGLLAGSLVCTAAGQARLSLARDAGVSMTASGPATLLWPPPYSYAITLKITNDGAAAASGLVLSTNRTPYTINGPVDCSSAPCTPDHIPLNSIPAMTAASVEVSFYSPSDYGTVHHAFTVFAADQSVSASASFDVDIVLPPTAADWAVAVTPPIGTGGLVSQHRVTATDLGPADAANVVVYDELDYREQLVSASPSQGSCSSEQHSTLWVVCQVGTLAAHVTFTLDVTTRLPPDPTGNGHLVQVGTTTIGPDGGRMNAFATALFPRFWICAVCGSFGFADGYAITKSFVLHSDDTVRFSDGSVIRRDGVVVRADCKIVRADGTIESPPAGAVAPCTGFPTPPQLASAVAGNASATVSWATPAFDGGSALTGYTVTSTPGGITTTVGASATSVVMNGLANGTSYTFSVRARNVLGSSPASTTAAVTPATVPASPTAVHAVASNGRATVTWTPPAFDGGSAVTGYTVISSPGARTVSTGASTTSVGISGLTNGRAYTFGVVAQNAVGPSTAASSNSVTPAKPAVPARPTLRRFAPVKGKVGTRVTIWGTGFRNAASVTFGGRPAKFNVLSSSRVVATVPKGASSGRIGVRTRGGTARSSKRFTVTKRKG